MNGSQDFLLNNNSLANALLRIADSGALAVLVTALEGPLPVGSKIVVEETGERTGTLGSSLLDTAVSDFAPAFLASREEAKTLRIQEFAPQLDELVTTRLLFERIAPEPRLVICGAGHVGASLARLACLAGYRATLIDDRAEFVKTERFAGSAIELVVAHGWTQAVAENIGNGRGVYVAVVTRGHNEDEECMRAVVAANPDYIGLIGSKRRTNIVLRRLQDTGVDPGVLKKVRAPIGLDIGAVTPEEVAVSILAEIVAERRGAKGGSMSAWRREG
jgi:xanthine dehydrogenase accessory factor